MRGRTNIRKALIYSMAWAVIGLAVACAIPVAHAEDDAPFEFDTGKWMSFDRYKDVLRSKPKQQTTTEKAPESAETADTEAKASQETINSANPVKVAAPSRPIDLPPMPGMNKGFGIHVESTTDKDDVAAKISNIETTPDLQISGDKWQKTSELSRVQDLHDRRADSDSDEKSSIDIRPSFLPNKTIKPVNLIPEHPGRRAVAEALAKKRAIAAAQPEKSPTELAACAAVDAFKKKQLAAIQSDRQTLVALQSAISTLGLQKQLSFMTDVQGSLNVQDTAAKIDVPATTAQQ